jgi:hypothetical protein
LSCSFDSRRALLVRVGSSAAEQVPVKYQRAGSTPASVTGAMQRTGGGQGPFPAVLHKTGREPALYGQDIAGFHPKDSDTYH